jgi:hypothetical protein
MSEQEKGMLQLGGIKCDNPRCFYREEDVQIHEYQDYVGKTCPMCGEILLTEEDMKTVKLLVAGISMGNQPTQEEKKGK